MGLKVNTSATMTYSPPSSFTMRAQAMFDSASFIGSARQNRRMPLRASVRNASAMKSGLAVSHEMNLKPVDMNCSGVRGVAAAMSRIRSHGSSFLYRAATPMCVEVVKSMARKPTRSITSAMASVLAVSMPSAAHRHWLPSRSEVSINWISAMVGVRARPHQDFAELHQRLISRQDLRDHTLDTGPYRIHELHDFDDPDDTVLIPRRADLDERRGSRPGRPVKCAEHGRCDLPQVRVG